MRNDYLSLLDEGQYSQAYRLLKPMLRIFGQTIVKDIYRKIDAGVVDLENEEARNLVEGVKSYEADMDALGNLFQSFHRKDRIIRDKMKSMNEDYVNSAERARKALMSVKKG